MKRVLIVDDDLWSLKIARQVLESHGFAVATAHDAPMAQRLLGEPFDVVLLDIHFPGGGGEAVLREIRARGGTMPVIAVTASAMSGDRERFLERGFTAYLSKPIDVRTFGQVVERIAAGRHG